MCITREISLLLLKGINKMKHKVKRENIEELHKLLRKSGLHTTESNKFLVKKDRKDTKQLLNQTDFLSDLDQDILPNIEDYDNET